MNLAYARMEKLRAQVYAHTEKYKAKAYADMKAKENEIKKLFKIKANRRIKQLSDKAKKREARAYRGKKWDRNIRREKKEFRLLADEIKTLALSINAMKKCFLTKVLSDLYYESHDKLSLPFLRELQEEVNMYEATHDLNGEKISFINYVTNDEFNNGYIGDKSIARTQPGFSDNPLYFPNGKSNSAIKNSSYSFDFKNLSKLEYYTILSKYEYYTTLSKVNPLYSNKIKSKGKSAKLVDDAKGEGPRTNHSEYIHTNDSDKIVQHGLSNNPQTTTLGGLFYSQSNSSICTTFSMVFSTVIITANSRIFNLGKGNQSTISNATFLIKFLTLLGCVSGSFAQIDLELVKAFIPPFLDILKHYPLVLWPLLLSISQIGLILIKGCTPLNEIIYALGPWFGYLVVHSMFPDQKVQATFAIFVPLSIIIVSTVPLNVINDKCRYVVGAITGFFNNNIIIINNGQLQP